MTLAPVSVCRQGRGWLGRPRWRGGSYLPQPPQLVPQPELQPPQEPAWSQLWSLSRHVSRHAFVQFVVQVTSTGTLRQRFTHTVYSSHTGTFLHTVVGTHSVT